MFTNALVSVSDKTGLLEAVRPLSEKGMRIVSTGGTAQYLKENHIPVVDISEQTGFPEVLDGRVKTLHPNVHMALLARRQMPGDMEVLKKNELLPFDLVIGNLYPFEEAQALGKTGEELIEKIDIGGPSFLRSAAKNYQSIAVFCDPKDYGMLLEGRTLNLADRQKLAAKVFYHVSSYDAMVAKQLDPELSQFWSLGGRMVQSLRYGENPHQNAAWYSIRGENEGIHKANILQGKALSYNNLLDLDAAASLVRQFSEPTVVAVKHNNPCGVASNSSLAHAADLCVKADPVSVFGGIIALNRVVDGPTAEILSKLFLECIIAPQISPDAQGIFNKKKNLRVLEWPGITQRVSTMELRGISGGFLLQDPDAVSAWDDSWKIIGDTPSQNIKNDLIFANRVAASLKSNAIALAVNQQSLGLGMGQVNRVEAVAHAIERWQKHHSAVRQPVLASDAFFPFPDSIELLAKAGVNWIIQPGGSMNDEAVISAAKEFKINMVLTGKRHFRH